MNVLDVDEFRNFGMNENVMTTCDSIQSKSEGFHNCHKFRESNIVAATEEFFEKLSG